MKDNLKNYTKQWDMISTNSLLRLLGYLTHSFPMHRKVFWCFQEVEQGWSGNKWFNAENELKLAADLWEEVLNN